MPANSHHRPATRNATPAAHPGYSAVLKCCSMLLLFIVTFVCRGFAHVTSLYTNHVFSQPDTQNVISGKVVNDQNRRVAAKVWLIGLFGNHDVVLLTTGRDGTFSFPGLVPDKDYYVVAQSLKRRERVKPIITQSGTGSIRGKKTGAGKAQSAQPATAPSFSNATASGGGPLFLIDGVPVTIPVQQLNVAPNDIKSIYILKGAGAIAVFGALGQGGVVIVETKNPDDTASWKLKPAGYFQGSMVSLKRPGSTPEQRLYAPQHDSVAPAGPEAEILP